MKKTYAILFSALLLCQTAAFAAEPAPTAQAAAPQPSALRKTGTAVRNFGSKVADTFFTYTFLILQKVGVA